jgi:hypothetical protein
VIAALALFVLFMVFVLPRQAEVSSRQLAGVGSPDMSFIYSADEIYAWAEAYGTDGREAYVQVRWSFDLAWPIVYGFFLVASISWVGRRAYRTGSRAHLLNLVPVAAVLLDYAENVLTSLVMLRYPTQTVVAATLASPVTVVKWLCVGGSFIALLAGLLAWIWRLLRERDFPHGQLQPSEEVNVSAQGVGSQYGQDGS